MHFIKVQLWWKKYIIHWPNVYWSTNNVLVQPNRARFQTTTEKNGSPLLSHSVFRVFFFFCFRVGFLLLLSYLVWYIAIAAGQHPLHTIQPVLSVFNHFNCFTSWKSSVTVQVHIVCSTAYTSSEALSTFLVHVFVCVSEWVAARTSPISCIDKVQSITVYIDVPGSI